jgi:hypothetical protein
LILIIFLTDFKKEKKDACKKYKKCEAHFVLSAKQLKAIQQFIQSNKKNATNM